MILLLKFIEKNDWKMDVDYYQDYMADKNQRFFFVETKKKEFVATRNVAEKTEFVEINTLTLSGRAFLAISVFSSKKCTQAIYRKIKSLST